MKVNNIPKTGDIYESHDKTHIIQVSSVIEEIIRAIKYKRSVDYEGKVVKMNKKAIQFRYNFIGNCLEENKLLNYRFVLTN